MRFDVAIIGGGPSGAVVALEAARLGYSVALIEGPRDNGWRIGESLPPVSRRALESLGLWSVFIEEGHLPCYGNCSAWGSAEPFYQSFIFDPYGNGWHLDRNRFDEMLRIAAAEAGAVRESGCKVIDCVKAEQGGWKLYMVCDEGRRFQAEARFAVDATGRQSWFARRQGARRINHDRMIALVCLLAPKGEASDGDSVTMIEATEQGWWYLALIPGSRLVVAFLCDADLKSARKAQELSGWLALLDRTKHIRKRIESHGYEVAEGPRIMAANSSCLDIAAGDYWLSVGDASAAFDPLSSQGIVTGLEMGAEAARAIHRRFQGDAAAVRGYTDKLGEVFARYLANLNFYYAQEWRWPGSVFWQRRAGPRKAIQFSIQSGDSRRARSK